MAVRNRQALAIPRLRVRVAGSFRVEGRSGGYSKHVAVHRGRIGSQGAEERPRPIIRPLRLMLRRRLPARARRWGILFGGRFAPGTGRTGPAHPTGGNHAAGLRVVDDALRHLAAPCVRRQVSPCRSNPAIAIRQPPQGCDIRRVNRVYLQPAGKKRTAGALVWLLAGMVIAGGAGCRQFAVYEVPGRRVADAVPGFWDCSASASGRAELAVRGLRGEFAVHPRRTFAALEAEALAAPAPDRMLALGELAYRIGQRIALTAPVEALAWNRDAAVYGVFALNCPTSTPAICCEAVNLHNRALARCLRLAYPEHHREPCEVLSRLAAANIDPAITDTANALAEYAFVLPADDFLVRGLNLHRRDGFGVPLLAPRELPEPAQRVGQERFFGRRVVPPLTAVIEPQGSPLGGAWRRQPVRLATFDPVNRDVVSPGPAALPLTLAADFTTPLAYQAGRMDISRFEWTGLVDPERLAEVTNIYQFRPYQPGKIPVLFIHGIFSSPSAWTVMFNELQGDPAVRARYQFWFAYYPSGHPIAYSVARLRRQLHALQGTIDPQGADPSLRRMVVVGHSMGSLVGRTLVQSSGQVFWNSFFTRPPDQVRLPDATRDLIRKVFLFEPEPAIRRVVFIAGPHRGSNIANRMFGRVTSALVRRSPEIAEMRQRVQELNGPEILQPTFRTRMMSSIDNLEWGSPMLQAMVRLPIDPGVPFHSIMGNIFAQHDPERWTDGVVEYRSAHLDGAASELVVPHTHSCQDKPVVIAEVSRILKEHLPRWGPRQARASHRIAKAWRHFEPARYSTRSRSSDRERCLMRSSGMAEAPRFCSSMSALGIVRIFPSGVIRRRFVPSSSLRMPLWTWPSLVAMTRVSKPLAICRLGATIASRR